MRETYDILKNIVSEEDILTREYMKNHTSFKIGGSADFLVTPRTVDQIQNLIITLKKENIPVFIMGNGSNLLVSDKGIRGVVIKLSKNFSSFSISGDEVTAQSGILLSTLSKSIVNSLLPKVLVVVISVFYSIQASFPILLTFQDFYRVI